MNGSTRTSVGTYQTFSPTKPWFDPGEVLAGFCNFTLSLISMGIVRHTATLFKIERRIGKAANNVKLESITIVVEATDAVTETS